MRRAGAFTQEPVGGGGGGRGSARAPSVDVGVAPPTGHPLTGPAARHAGAHAGIFLDQVAVVAITLGTAVAAARAWPRAESAAARVQPLAMVAAQSACALFLFAYPREYSRHRAWLSPLLRIVVACMPSARKMGLGPAVILERPAQPGARGALLDLLRLLLGTRVIAVFGVGIGAMLPPLSALVCQTAVTLLIMNSLQACQTELLRHPLTRGRMAAATRLLDAFALPLVAFQPALPLLWQPLGGEALCQASVCALMLVAGVVLPVLATIFCWQPGERQQRQQQQQQQTSAPTRRQGADVCQHCGALRAVLGRLGPAAAGADFALHRLLGGQLPGHARLAMLWFCVAVTWLLCKQIAGLA